MKARKRVIIPTVICFVLIIIGMIITVWIEENYKINKDILQWNSKVREVALKDTGALSRERLLSQKKDIQISEKDKIILRHRMKDAILKYYKERGMLQKYTWVTPDFIYSVIVWVEKYECLTGDYNFETINKVKFILAWITNESNFDMNCIKINEHQARDDKGKLMWDKNGKPLMEKTYDISMCQLNSVNWYLQKNLPDSLMHLKNRSLKDPETSIAVFCLWFDKACYETVWTLHTKFRDDGGKKMYAILQGVK